MDRSASAPESRIQADAKLIEAEPTTVLTMAEQKKGWKPATVGEAREYLDTHKRDADPAIVAACEAMIDVIEHRSGPGEQSSGAHGHGSGFQASSGATGGRGSRLVESGMIDSAGSTDHVDPPGAFDAIDPQRFGFDVY